MDVFWRRLLCKYDLRKRGLFVLNWERVRRGSVGMFVV